MSLLCLFRNGLFHTAPLLTTLAACGLCLVACSAADTMAQNKPSIWQADEVREHRPQPGQEAELLGVTVLSCSLIRGTMKGEISEIQVFGTLQASIVRIPPHLLDQDAIWFIMVFSILRAEMPFVACSAVQPCHRWMPSDDNTQNVWRRTFDLIWLVSAYLHIIWCSYADFSSVSFSTVSLVLPSGVSCQFVFCKRATAMSLSMHAAPFAFLACCCVCCVCAVPRLVVWQAIGKVMSSTLRALRMRMRMRMNENETRWTLLWL